MTAKEIYNLISSMDACFLYTKQQVIDNTELFLKSNGCNDMALDVIRYNRNSQTTYFSPWKLRNGDFCSIPYAHNDHECNKDIDAICDYLKDVVIIETPDHEIVWAEKEIDGCPLVGHFVLSESLVSELLKQNALLRGLYEKEPTAIRLYDKLYSKSQLEDILRNTKK